MRRATPVTWSLLALNFLVFIWQTGQPVQNYAPLMLWPADTPYFQFWQVVSYGFLHDAGGWTHVGFNMFALWMFGKEIEAFWGPRRFAIYYFVCLVGAALVQLAVTQLEQSIYPTLGASGAVFGILLAFGMMFPNRRILLLIPPIPMKAKYFVLLYGALELFLGVSDMMSQVAHFAHLGGMLFGLGLILWWSFNSNRREQGGDPQA